jgi:hypothetical protein
MVRIRERPQETVRVRVRVRRRKDEAAGIPAGEASPKTYGMVCNWRELVN